MDVEKKKDVDKNFPNILQTFWLYKDIFYTNSKDNS